VRRPRPPCATGGDLEVRRLDIVHRSTNARGHGRGERMVRDDVDSSVDLDCWWSCMACEERGWGRRRSSEAERRAPFTEACLPCSSDRQTPSCAGDSAWDGDGDTMNDISTCGNAYRDGVERGLSDFRVGCAGVVECERRLPPRQAPSFPLTRARRRDETRLRLDDRPFCHDATIYLPL
jgi:hypothetical protein